MRNFYKSCFTGQVRIGTLIKAFKENKVSDVFRDLGKGKSFWIKVVIFHYYMRFKVLGGQLKRMSIHNR